MKNVQGSIVSSPPFPLSFFLHTSSPIMYVQRYNINRQRDTAPTVSERQSTPPEATIQAG